MAKNRLGACCCAFDASALQSTPYIETAVSEATVIPTPTTPYEYYTRASYFT